MSVQRTFVRDGEAVTVKAEPVGGDHWRVRVGDRGYEFRVAQLGDGGVRLVPVGVEAAPACVAYGVPAGKAFMVRVGGRTFTLESPEGRRRDVPGADGCVRAPMTGTVLGVSVREGDVVEADQTLVVLSAMKMEHKLTAGIAGVVRTVAASPGAAVEQGALLVQVEPSS
jgi:acetyl/propionyl-CoA carboxylase alpha subunit